VALLPQEQAAALSVSSNGSTWVKLYEQGRGHHVGRFLSVSSNGSTWVKLTIQTIFDRYCRGAFSILERIDVGET